MQAMTYIAEIHPPGRTHLKSNHICWLKYPWNAPVSGYWLLGKSLSFIHGVDLDWQAREVLVVKSDVNTIFWQGLICG